MSKITTLVQYETELLRFDKVTACFKAKAVEIAVIVESGNIASAKEIFKAYCADKKLVYWESLVLSDLVAIERAKLNIVSST